MEIFLIEADTYGGAFDSPFELYYSAPKEITEHINYKKKTVNL
jgi:hypothetical protein